MEATHKYKTSTPQAPLKYPYKYPHKYPYKLIYNALKYR